MRIIFLNSWFGKRGKPFFDFLKKESPYTEILCLMEVSPDLFSKSSEILDDFRGIYETGGILKSFEIIDGMAVFVKKGYEVLSNGKFFIYHNSCNDTGFAQDITFEKSGKTVNLISVHGKSRPGHKKDTPARLAQSRKIIEFFKEKKGMKIIGGDFNLLPDTRSIKMFEEAGYRNLVKEFNVKSTRNKFAWNQSKNEPGYVRQNFADYVFASSDVKVDNFEVPYMEISDHLPLILEYEI